MKKLTVLLFLFPFLYASSQDWESKYDYVDNCVCGLSKVKKEGKIGYVDKLGKEVIKPQYEEGLTFHEGYTAVKTGGKWLYLDSLGKPITEAVYEEALTFTDGMACVGKNNLFGFIDTNGKTVIALQFSNARGFTEGFAPAANAKGFWGYIDMKGNWQNKAQYDFADDFENGKARVILGQKVMYIDKNNQHVQE